MKIASLTCIVIGLVGALMAGLTALGVSPGFIDFGLFDMIGGDAIIDAAGLDSFKSMMTTAFWGGLSVLSLLAAIGFGVITDKE